MGMRYSTGLKSIALGSGCAFALVLGAGMARAEAPAEASAEEAAPLLDPDALAVANRAGDFLRETKRFSFSAESGYEVVQEDGSKIEFGNTRRYVVQRPDRVRVENEPREGERRLTVFDGKSFVQADLGENVYARTDLKRPRDIDFVIDLLRERLDSPIPLAELLRNNPRQAIEDSLEAADVVGRERLRGMDCDHIALRNPDADLQLWIARGERPLVQRVVITYRNLDGQPSFWADLDDWSFAPEIDAATFHYAPPEGAERVRFEVRPAPAPAPSEEGSP
jgi:hypothetical protein